MTGNCEMTDNLIHTKIWNHEKIRTKTIAANDTLILSQDALGMDNA